MSDDSAKIVITPADLAHSRDSVIRIHPEVPSASPAEISGQCSGPITTRPWRRWRVLLGIVAVIVVSVAGFLSRQRPANTDWIESVVAATERSVVQLRCDAAMGTGTVIATDGRRVLILTNKHVLSAGHGLTTKSTGVPVPCDVQFRSGSRAPGQLVGWAKKDNIDLALVLADTFDPPPPLAIVEFANIRTGKQVIAIGHPLGLDFTVTEGIISAKREGLWLQTTAAINHGSSGGPIIDRSGRLLGINTMFVEGKGPAYGFALRADYVTFREAWQFSHEIDDLLQQILATHHEAP